MIFILRRIKYNYDLIFDLETYHGNETVPRAKAGLEPQIIQNCAGMDKVIVFFDLL